MLGNIPARTLAQNDDALADPRTQTLREPAADEDVRPCDALQIVALVDGVRNEGQAPLGLGIDPDERHGRRLSRRLHDGRHAHARCPIVRRRRLEH